MPDTLKLRVSHEDGIFKRKLEKKKEIRKIPTAFKFET